MTHLTDLIDEFLTRYPDDATLTWRDKPRRRAGGAARAVLETAVGDLVTASERARANAGDPEQVTR